MYFYSEDIIILREIFNLRRLNIFYFHEKYLLSPGQLARSLNNFIENKIIQIKENEIIITDFGIKWIISNRKKLFLQEKDLFWKEIPEYMTKKQLMINKLYKPKHELIDKNFLHQKLLKKRQE